MLLHCLFIVSLQHIYVYFNFDLILTVVTSNAILLKQGKLPVLDTTGFFFRIRTHVTALVLHTSVFIRVLMLKKKLVISNKSRFVCFISTVSYTYLYCLVCFKILKKKPFVSNTGNFPCFNSIALLVQ
jgi:hypothetical protein